MTNNSWKGVDVENNYLGVGTALSIDYNTICDSRRLAAEQMESLVDETETGHVSIHAVSDVTAGNRAKWRQIYACVAMGMLCLTKGLSNGWGSPMIQILENGDTPVGKMSPSQISLLQTLPQYAAIVGVVVVTFCLIRYGTIVSSFVLASISIVGYIILLVARNVICMYCGRFLTGTSAVGVDVVSSFYLSEVAGNSIRGRLIAFSIFAGQFGTFLGYLLGVICSYVVFNGVCLIPAVLAPILIYWSPESPFHLMRQGKTEAAVKSYVWFQDVSEEIAEMRVAEMDKLRNKKINFKAILSNRVNQRALLILAFLSAFTMFCGTGVVSSYTSEIFKKAGGSIDPNKSALLMASVTFVSSLVGALLIDYLGRRFLLLFAFILMSLSLYTITAFFILKGEHLVNTNFVWMIYAGLACYTGSNALGLVPVTQTIGAEMVPSGIKGILWLFAGLATLLTSAGTLHFYAFVTSDSQYYVNFLIFAIFSTASIIITIKLVPETKGKSLQEITLKLNGGVNDS